MTKLDTPQTAELVSDEALDEISGGPHFSTWGLDRRTYTPASTATQTNTGLVISKNAQR